MPNKLSTLLDNAQSGNDTSALILDAEEYAQKVLLQGKSIPWHDATAYANHFGQTVALLKPQAAVIALDKMIEQELADNQELTTAMGEKSRSGYALRTFMGNEDFKAAASALVAATVKTQRVPVLIQLPSPLQLMYLTAGAAQPDGEHEFDDDDAENAAMYCADWLRAFKDADIAGLLFDERKGDVSEEAYQPITNTADHYDWSIGVRRESDIRFRNPETSIAVLPTSYWTSGETGGDTTASVFSEVAQDAVPEQVLEYREKLR